MANSEDDRSSGGITEQLSGYLAMVAGLRRATRERAAGMAHELLAQAGLDDVATDAQQRVSRLTDEIVAAGRANRSMVQSLIRGEVDKALDRALATLHFARADDVADLRAAVDDLQQRVDQLDLEQSGAAGWSVADPGPVPDPAAERAETLDDDPVAATAAAREAAARIADRASVAPAKKAPAKKAPAKKAPAAKKATTTSASRVPAATPTARTAKTAKAAKTSLAKTSTAKTAKTSTSKTASAAPARRRAAGKRTGTARSAG
ncbi:polyhydroxyalkanoate synthesis regulator phasin [Friedmanniella endophytica]|uniref:Polyhydroxyalkanoate synthesis regulator phasin n=1 Tax=Microlunatus kandeliicorticis TaxID=1759536 RepID=A0A7W3IU27_9ACTN|nr:hypothetical protein [Microlunatus kandeliicorticis]MBA8795278.1 polyhydroxyalkanoate synthesis regulator phasin [Microlunatus kandeliicorticis]